MIVAEADRREAFTALFSQMSPRLYRTALGILGNPHDAADALQEAGMKAYRYFGQLQKEEAAAGWLTRIVVNCCYDQGRRRSRMIPTGLELLGDERAKSQNETDWELVEALQSLPDEQRTTVVLRFFQDLTVPQIAQVMSVPEGTVKSRLFSALGKLRTTLTQGREEGVR